MKYMVKGYHLERKSTLEIASFDSYEDAMNLVHAIDELIGKTLHLTDIGHSPWDIEIVDVLPNNGEKR